MSRDKDACKGIKTTLESLKSLMNKVKTEGVKELVERVFTQFNILLKVRADLHDEFTNELNVST